MKLDVFKQPDPIVIGEGESAFKLFVKAITGEERMAVFDAVAAMSFVSINAAVGRLVIAWEDVCGGDGNPIPLETLNERGVKGSNLQAMLGALPTPMHGETIGALLAFAGVPVENAQAVARGLGCERDLRPTK